MDLSKVRSITNNYHDVRLVSLREWGSAHEFPTRDPGGPYMVVQEGYDPADFKMRPNEFVLGKSGAWTTVGVFLKLPRDIRRQEFIFGTAAEVIQRLSDLPSKVRTSNQPEEMGTIPVANDDDDLPDAFAVARDTA